MGAFTEHFLTNRLEKGVRLLYCGHEGCEPGHGWGPGMRGHFLLHHVVKGKGTMTIPGMCSSRVREGESFCVFPNLPVLYRADEDDPWEYYWAGFEGEHVEDYLRRAGFSERAPLLSGLKQEALARCFDKLIERSAGRQLADELACTGLMLELLAHYMEKGDQLVAANRSGSTDGTNGEETAMEAVNFIRAHYQRKLTVSMLARHVGLERSYFTKRFQAWVGVPPYEFITRYRLEQAVHLLVHTDLPIETVAYSVGFEEPSYFAKRFSERHGSPPSVFRRENR
ncbi:AraC family transcriptional regulator [Gorillibacterium timonense]|uniref:AraC family transcriptional regulator n=1 Tax=Gorillibacterium timonense TaxID=1689269 RepID=UPI00071CAA05|nr:AraC family transcriptional regulator [Gorillibacterium timonense]